MCQKREWQRKERGKDAAEVFGLAARTNLTFLKPASQVTVQHLFFTHQVNSQQLFIEEKRDTGLQ